MKKIVSALLFMLLAVSVSAKDTGPEQEVAAVKRTIVSAYVQGIHIDRDIEAITKGFHPEFTMIINTGEGVRKLTIDKWIEGIKKSKEANPGPPAVKTTHSFTSVQVAGNAAAVQIEIYQDGRHKFTDFMSLYKFTDGWKIVSKIYHSHF